MELAARVNNDLFIRNSERLPEQEAWLVFGPGTVTVVTDIFGRGAPFNAFRFTAEDLHRIADMITLAEPAES